MPPYTFGVEGTGSWGAGLARYLAAQHVAVFEVNRPNRQARRSNGKSDPADADAAASAVLAGDAAGRPKSGDDKVEMVRVLRVARKTAMKARTQAMNALQAVVVTAPAELRESLRVLSGFRSFLPLRVWLFTCTTEEGVHFRRVPLPPGEISWPLLGSFHVRLWGELVSACGENLMSADTWYRFVT